VGCCPRISRCRPCSKQRPILSAGPAFMKVGPALNSCCRFIGSTSGGFPKSCSGRTAQKFFPFAGKKTKKNYDSTAFAASPTLRITLGFPALVLVITTTLVRTNRVPNTVLRPSDSPPRKYPTSTATTGFT
jgi:hypothetical protein